MVSLVQAVRMMIVVMKSLVVAERKESVLILYVSVTSGTLVSSVRTRSVQVVVVGAAIMDSVTQRQAPAHVILVMLVMDVRMSCNVQTTAPPSSRDFAFLPAALT